MYNIDSLFATQDKKEEILFELYKSHCILYKFLLFKEILFMIDFSLKVKKLNRECETHLQCRELFYVIKVVLPSESSGMQTCIFWAIFL